MLTYMVAHNTTNQWVYKELNVKKTSQCPNIIFYKKKLFLAQYFCGATHFVFGAIPKFLGDSLELKHFKELPITENVSRNTIIATKVFCNISFATYVCDGFSLKKQDKKKNEKKRKKTRE